MKTEIKTQGPADRQIERSAVNSDVAQQNEIAKPQDKTVKKSYTRPNYLLRLL